MAALSLAKSGDFSKKVSSILSEALSSGDPILTETVLASMSTMVDPGLDELVEPLSLLLSSEQRITRGLATKTLGRTGKTGLSAILWACRSDAEMARRGGAQALAIYCQRFEPGDSKGSKRQIFEMIESVLRELLRSDDRTVVLMALSAVTELGAEAGSLLPYVSAPENAEDRLIAPRAQRAMRAILEGKGKAEQSDASNPATEP